MALIEFKNVSKRFGRKEVLKDLSLSVGLGETFTIIGGSGTGKSLTLKLILALLYPDAGHIYFKGEDVTQMGDDELLRMRSHIGMLFQGAALFDSLSVYENVAYPLREHFHHPEKIAEIVKTKLELVGLEGIEDLFPAELSGGMKKRVGLARAIATDPEVVLYDEPTAGLDPANTNRIGELITQLQEKLKMTSVVVTHDMQFAFHISNRMALLHNRRIEFEGSVEEIKRSSNSLVQNFIRGEIGEL